MPWFTFLINAILGGARLLYKLLGQGYVKESLNSFLSKLFYGRYGGSIKQYEAPCSKYYITFWSMIICRNTLYWADITLTRDIDGELELITDFDLITKFRYMYVSIEYL